MFRNFSPGSPGRVFILPVLPILGHPDPGSTLNLSRGIRIYILGIWSKQMIKCFIGVLVFCDLVRVNKELYFFQQLPNLTIG